MDDGTGAHASTASRRTNDGCAARRQTDQTHEANVTADPATAGGNIVEFGHVNIGVSDQAVALDFYVAGLGLTRDPFERTGTDNAWINVGTAQFHLPVGKAQILRGIVHLRMPDTAALLGRLESVRARLHGSSFDFHADGRVVDVRCPWGNRIRIHPSPGQHAADGQTPAMPCVELHCPPGTAGAIAGFYERVIGTTPATTGHNGVGAFARVAAGPSTTLLFLETAAPLPAWDGHHIQITVADFAGVHHRMRRLGLITEESSDAQFRFDHIIDPSTGRLLLQIEHEVRSLAHPMFGRVLVNHRPRSDTDPRPVRS